MTKSAGRPFNAAVKPVSAIIPCLDPDDVLEKLIESIAKQSGEVEEIIVVDDGSSPAIDTRKFEPPLVRVIAHPRNLGLATARNTGIMEARTKFVAFFDCDVVPAPDAIEKMLARIASDENVVGVGGRAIEVSRENLADRWRANFWVQSLGESLIEDAPFLPGLGAMFRRDALLDAGMYDARFRTNGEDVDVSQRLISEGGRLVYDPEVELYHHRRDDLRSILRMVRRHALGQMNALLKNAKTSQRSRAEAMRTHVEGLKWLFVAPMSSLRRHRSLPLAALSAICCLSAIEARIESAVRAFLGG
ncbi:MAG: glycosyltransferase [Planctomycetes bacterium]|nr:glycosyltransferase [Planctomycetota bacterium]